MASLTAMARGRFKNIRHKSKSNNMAKNGRRKKSSGRRKSGGGSGSGVFSGKILGFKIPVIGNALRNRTVQKVIAGAGIVAIVLSVARLINNPTLNRAANNKFVKLGLAGAAGDVTGIATQFVIGGGVSQLRGITNGGNGNGQTLVSMSGNGIA